MNSITKTVLLCMTLSVFFALFQLLLKGENFRKDKKNNLAKEQSEPFLATLREEKESILILFPDSKLKVLSSGKILTN